MDGASAIAGLAGLVLQTILQIRTICEEYSIAKDEIDWMQKPAGSELVN